MMRLSKSRKGMIVFNLAIVILALLVLITAFIELNHTRDPKTTYGTNLLLGRSAVRILQSYADGEASLLYVDLAAKYSVYYALYELAQKGGLGVANEKCGQYKGYNVLYNKGEECFPQDFGTEFAPAMNEAIDEYLQKNTQVAFPKDNYDVSVSQEEDVMNILGRAKSPIEFPVVDQILPGMGVSAVQIPGTAVQYDASETAVHTSATTEGCEILIPGPDTFSVNQCSNSQGGGRLVNGFNMGTGTDYTFTTGSINKLEGMYGTKELAYAMMATGCALKQKFDIKLKHGDLSLQSGGDIKGHGSHESGRDVDITFIWKKQGSDKLKQYSGKAVDDPPPRGGIPDKCPRAKGWKNQGAGFPLDPDFHLPSNWELVKNWFLNSESSVVFLHCDIIRALRDYAQTNDPEGWKLVETKFNKGMHFWKNHHNHYHMRICCPEGDTECKNQFPRCTSPRIA